MTVPRLTGIHTQGNGPLLVLGPSLGTSTALWDPAAPALREHFDLLAWDLPGHGESATPGAYVPSEAFSIEELADAVIALVDEAGVDRFVYAGVSVGGAVALELALKYPDRVSGVAVICSAAYLGGPVGWTERAEIVRTRGTPALVDQSAKRWFAPDFIARQPEIASKLLHTLSDANDEGYALCCEALGGYDMRDRLAEVTVPVIAIAGAHDVVAPPEAAEAVAAGVANGRAVVIDSAAHLAPAEAPAEVAGHLIEFFGGIK